MKTLKFTTLALVVSLASGCATRGANYIPLVDLKGKDTQQFNTDTTECQAYAKQRMDAAQGAVIGAVAGALLMAAFAPRGYRNDFAAHGAVAGGLGGAVSSNDTQETVTKRCLAGRGYNVLN